MFRILNYLPASLGSLPKPSRLGSASWQLPSMDSSMPWIISTTGDHEVRWECLGYVELVVMCAEGFEEICNRSELVNHINEFSRKFFLKQHNAMAIGASVRWRRPVSFQVFEATKQLGIQRWRGWQRRVVF